MRLAEQSLGYSLPPLLIALLRVCNGFMLDDGTKLFPTDEIVERNVTLEVREYMPGYVAFADDSGDQAYILCLDPQNSRVYQVGVGVMMEDELKEVAPDLASWLKSELLGVMWEDGEE